MIDRHDLRRDEAAAPSGPGLYLGSWDDGQVTGKQRCLLAVAKSDRGSKHAPDLKLWK